MLFVQGENFITNDYKNKEKIGDVDSISVKQNSLHAQKMLFTNRYFCSSFHAAMLSANKLYSPRSEPKKLKNQIQNNMDVR